MQAIGAPAALPDGYLLGPVSTVALRGITHSVQLYQQPHSANAGSFGASKLFYIELDHASPSLRRPSLQNNVVAKAPSSGP
jgi:hypothetical protein